jgi:hypothetical protein
VLLSEALAGTTGAPPALTAPAQPAALAARLRDLPAAELREHAAVMAAGRGWPEVARRHLELYEEVAA